jgi:hypothetical protein
LAVADWFWVMGDTQDWQRGRFCFTPGMKWCASAVGMIAVNSGECRTSRPPFGGKTASWEGEFMNHL